MRIAVAGSSGLIGQALVSALLDDGHDILRLVRRPSRRDASNEVVWAPERGALDPHTMEGIDAVVNLAGRNVADARWSRRFKQELRSSRLDATRALVGAMAEFDRPPRTLLNASSIGIYGDRGDEILTERSTPGDGFLTELCEAWEATAETARESVERVIHLRFGVVLAAEGGALEALARVMRRGAGGALGSGRQIWSWIALADAIDAIRFCLDTERIDGPVNVVAPEPTTNTELTQTLANVLGRSVGPRLPAPVLRLSLGEIADALLLASAHVEPTVLAEHGFHWQLEELEDALRNELADSATDAAASS